MTAPTPAAAATEDLLILVDEADRQTGTLAKTACHLGTGHLHRAFSVFLFNRHGEVLLQQRAAGKMLWSGYWSNSVCSHPRAGEDTAEAAHRRVREELGIDCTLRFLYKFHYQACFGDVGAEHELCHVYAGRSGDPRRIDAGEISAWRWVSPTVLDDEIAHRGQLFSPWMKLEWTRIRNDFLDGILADNGYS